MQEPIFLIRPENGVRRVLPFSLATLAHVLALFSLLGASYLAVEPVVPPQPPPDWTVWVVIPPPGDASPAPEKHAPPAKGGATARETPPPSVVPETLPDLPPVEPESEVQTPEPEGTGDPGSGGEGGPGSPTGPGGTGQGEAGPGGLGSGPGGGDGPLEVTSEMMPPVLLVKVEPEYPEVMRTARMPGRVVVEAVVGTEGSVEEAEILSATNSIFGEAAVAAVRRWKYRPALQGGAPVRVYFRVLVEFVIR